MSRKTKSIISGIVLVALVAGVLALAVSLLGKDTKSIGSGKFDVGAINAEGVYVKNDRSIYTKDLIECQGLSIEPDFEATGTYQVFYYGEGKNFIGSTEVMNAEDGVYNKGTNFVEAKYCRIMITPDVPLDEDGNEEENFKIRFYQVAGYANDYNITVDKKQNFKVFNYYELDPDMVGKRINVNSETGEKTVTDDAMFYASKWFEVEPGMTFKVGIKNNFEGEQYVMFAYKLADGKYRTSAKLTFSGTKSGDMIWEEITINPDYDIVSVCAFVQDCTGEYPDLIINRVS